MPDQMDVAELTGQQGFSGLIVINVFSSFLLSLNNSQRV
jgi:hypothetical protein